MSSDNRSTETVRHAGRMDDDRTPLCGSSVGRATRPKETINCPDCRVIVNHIRATYPSHAEYMDWRATKKQRAAAAEAMYRDLVAGEVDG